MKKISQRKFGAYIRNKRISRGMTRSELAERLFVTEDAVAKWERGVRYPDFEMVGLLADELGITVQDIYDNSEENGNAVLPIIITSIAVFLVGAFCMFAIRKNHDNRQFPATEAETTVKYTEAETSELDTEKYKTEYDEKGRVTLLSSKENFTEMKKTLTSKEEKELEDKSIEIARKYIDFKNDVSVKDMSDEISYQYRVTGKTEDGFETGNIANVYYLGDGTFYSVQLFYDDAEAVAGETIGEKAAYDIAIKAIKEKYGTYTLSDLTAFDELEEISKIQRDGVKKYIYKIMAKCAESGGENAEFDVFIDANTGEVLQTASSLSVS